MVTSLFVQFFAFYLFHTLIRAIDAENIKIMGEDGSVIYGDNCYDEIGEEDDRGPHAICFFDVKFLYCAPKEKVRSCDLTFSLTPPVDLLSTTSRSTPTRSISAELSEVGRRREIAKIRSIAARV